MMLGDLTVSQIERRLGIELTEEERNLMNGTYNANASNISVGKWHCFDIPFMIVCGDMEFASKLNTMLTPYAQQMKCQLQIGF